ncbi:hypothetical protein AB0F07_34300 [Streptomyces fructofermentans]|uniref:hypothetical protein n=1 Tax=Streptomyces fructofermentans TaxID=152141 RepID=UPI00340234A7
MTLSTREETDGPEDIGTIDRRTADGIGLDGRAEPAPAAGNGVTGLNDGTTRQVLVRLRFDFIARRDLP